MQSFLVPGALLKTLQYGFRIHIHEIELTSDSDVSEIRPFLVTAEKHPDILGSLPQIDLHTFSLSESDSIQIKDINEVNVVVYASIWLQLM